jgi:small-conductance mechanosensitive channel
MSDSERPETVAFRELEQLVRHLGDELAGFRRRALLAESRLRELESEDAPSKAQQKRELGDRLTQLEHENAILKGRLESATERTRQMLDRVHFIRQQAQGTER